MWEQQSHLVIVLITTAFRSLLSCDAVFDGHCGFSNLSFYIWKMGVAELASFDSSENSMNEPEIFFNIEEGIYQIVTCRGQRWHVVCQNGKKWHVCAMCEFVSAYGINIMTKITLERKGFIWLSILGFVPFFLGGQGRNLRHHVHSQEQGENKCTDPCSLSTQIALSALTQFRAQPREWCCSLSKWVLPTSINCGDKSPHTCLQLAWVRYSGSPLRIIDNK